MDLATKLQALGFAPDSATKAYLAEVSHALDLSHNGPHVVQEVFTKSVSSGTITVTIEQNTSPDDLGGGMTAVVTHPPVAIIDGPKGYRVAFNPVDVDLAEHLVTELE